MKKQEKYPIDSDGVVDLTRCLVRQDEAQKAIIRKLVKFLREAMSYVHDESGWYEDAERLIQSLYQRDLDFKNFRFDKGNGHKKDQISPYEEDEMHNEDDDYSPDNGIETPMSAEELAAHFGETLPAIPKKPVKAINKMSLEEIKEWEAQQDNSNDIYKIAARIKNEARGKHGEATLTTVGVSLCNMFTHMLKSFYDFAETIPDKEVKIRLIELIRRQEKVPGDFIRAMHSGVHSK